MARLHKIKRSSEKQVYKAGPHPVTIILAVLVAGGLLLLGFSIYGPLLDFLDDLRAPQPPVIEVSSEPPSQPESSAVSSEPEPPVLPEAPELVRAVTMPNETAIYRSSWDAFLQTVPEGCNTVMVELKNKDGQVLFATKNEYALKWGAVAENLIDLVSLGEYLREHGLYLAARISSLADPLAARAGQDAAAIMHNTGVLWFDDSPSAGGKPWLNLYAKQTRDYLKLLALEAADAGAVLVLLDSYQFPRDITNVAVYGETGGVKKQEMLVAFARELSGALREKGSRLSVYLPVASLDEPESSYNLMCYGGSPLDIAADEIALGMHPDYLAGDTPVEKLAPALERAVLALAGRDIRLLPVLTATQAESYETQLPIITALGVEEYILN